MRKLSQAGLGLVQEIASRHGVSTEAASQLLDALANGSGTQAQFNHPELGGMGQWSRGGMIMIGDMFNNGLKYRVDALCTELADLLAAHGPVFEPAPSSQSQRQGAAVSLFVSGVNAPQWPVSLGTPTSTGSQNDLSYAVFSAARRLAIRKAGRMRVYDTGDHSISGFSQQQGNDQSLTFTSQFGVVHLSDLTEAGETGVPPDAAPIAPLREFQPEIGEGAQRGVETTSPVSAAMQPAALSPDQIFQTLERLAELHQKGIVSEAEFAAKKTELLARI